MERATPRRALRTVRGAGEGVRCFFLGLKFVWEHRRRLVFLVLPPMILCLVIVVAAMIVIVQGVPAIVDSFWSEPSSDAWWGAKHFLWQWLELPVAILLGIVASLAALLVAFVLFSLLTAAFCDALSEKVEVLRGTFEPLPFSWAFFAKDLLESLRLELAHVGLKLVWLFPLFVASLVIPVVGPVVYVVGGGYLLARRTGMDYLDWCGARRGWDYRQRLDFMRRHRPAVLGFGACVVLAWALPFAFVVLWPAAVAGGAILFSELQGGEDPHA